MNMNVYSVVSYWRNSLADAELGKGTWHNASLSTLIIRQRPELLAATLDPIIVRDLYRNEDDSVPYLNVAVYPILFKLKSEHGSKKQHALPDVITPIVIRSILLRDGRLLPTPKIFVARDLLQPLEKDSFSIGHIDQLDVFLTNNPPAVPNDLLVTLKIVDDATDENDEDTYSQDALRIKIEASWREALSYADHMLEKVAKDDALRMNGYLRTRDWVIKKVGSTEYPSKRIFSLYDHIRQ